MKFETNAKKYPNSIERTNLTCHARYFCKILKSLTEHLSNCSETDVYRMEAVQFRIYVVNKWIIGDHLDFHSRKHVYVLFA